MLLPISLSKSLLLEEYGIFLSGISTVGIIASFMMGILKIKHFSKFNFMIYMFMLSNVLIIASLACSNKWLFMSLFILSTFAKIFANSIFNASFMISIPQKKSRNHLWIYGILRLFRSCFINNNLWFFRGIHLIIMGIRHWKSFNYFCFY